MNLNKPAVIKKLQERFRNVNAGRGLYTAFLVPTMLTMFSTRAFAADTIWTKASAIMQDVYTQILGISTIAAVVTAAIALLLMNFSRSGRTVDESRAWLKRIIITWAILNNLTCQENRIFDHLRKGKRLIPLHIHDNVLHGNCSFFRSIVIIIELSVSKRTDNANYPYWHLEYR